MITTQTVFQKASFCREKCDHEAFLPVAGQRSRAIIPGDDPGDQQPPEPRGFNPDLLAVAPNAGLTKIRRDRTPG
jgi:hypothetical protein